MHNCTLPPLWVREEERGDGNCVLDPFQTVFHPVPARHFARSRVRRWIHSRSLCRASWIRLSSLWMERKAHIYIKIRFHLPLSILSLGGSISLPRPPCGVQSHPMSRSRSSPSMSATSMCVSPLDVLEKREKAGKKKSEIIYKSSPPCLSGGCIPRMDISIPLPHLRVISSTPFPLYVSGLKPLLRSGWGPMFNSDVQLPMLENVLLPSFLLLPFSLLFPFLSLRMEWLLQWSVIWAQYSDTLNSLYLHFQLNHCFVT